MLYILYYLSIHILIILLVIHEEMIANHCKYLVITSFIFLNIQYYLKYSDVKILKFRKKDQVSQDLCQRTHCQCFNKTACNILISDSYTKYNKTAALLSDICFQRYNRNDLHILAYGTTERNITINGFKIVFSKHIKVATHVEAISIIFIVNSYVMTMSNLFHFFTDFLIDFFTLMRYLQIPNSLKKKQHLMILH